MLCLCMAESIGNSTANSSSIHRNNTTKLLSLTIEKCDHNKSGTKKLVNIDITRTFLEIFNAHHGPIDCRGNGLEPICHRPYGSTK